MSPWHWAVVVIVVVLLFGSKRLPDAARSLGRSARILKAELHSGTDPDRAAEPGATTAATSTPPAAPAPPPTVPPAAV